MKNQDLIIRDTNGGFIDCVNLSDIKSLVIDGNEIFLSSFFEDNLTLTITSFGNEFWIKCEAFPLERFKRFPMKKISRLIKCLNLDTIDIN
jgi:hypothetical protein